jgi:flagellar hook-basal body complex protein FliE
MKKAVNDVVGGFVSGLKTGVTGSSAMKFEVDLSTKTNKKIDEIVANVNFLQEKTVKDTEKIIKGFSKDLKDVVVELIDKTNESLEKVSDKVDHRWKITQWLLATGMIGNAAILILTI